MEFEIFQIIETKKGKIYKMLECKTGKIAAVTMEVLAEKKMPYKVGDIIFIDYKLSKESV